MIMNRQLVVITVIFSYLLIQGCSTASKSSQITLPSTSQVTIKNQTQLYNALNKQYSAWKGAPYKIDGNSKSGVDCSGFVHIAFKNALGLQLPRSTKLLANAGNRVPVSQLKVGDLVFFKTGYNKRHVGIYMGKGQFMHASTSKGVMKSSLNAPYWANSYWKSNRVLII